MLKESLASKSCLTVALGLLLGAVTSIPASAEEVSLTITGVVVDDPNALVGVGEPFEAGVVYDTTNFVDGFKYFPVDITFTVGPYTVTNAEGAINVEPSVVGIDSYQIVDEGLSANWNGQIAGSPVQSFGLNFQGWDENELDDFVSTEPYVLDLAEWEVANGGVTLSNGASISVDVLTFELAPSDPAELIAGLVADVIGLNLQKGITNSLDAKLDSALNALEDLNTNNDVAAINSLQAFINAVQAQRGNKIPEADADALIASAQAIIDLLNAS